MHVAPLEDLDDLSRVRKVRRDPGVFSDTNSQSLMQGGTGDEHGARKFDSIWRSALDYGQVWRQCERRCWDDAPTAARRELTTFSLKSALVLSCFLFGYVAGPLYVISTAVPPPPPPFPPRDSSR